MFLVTGFPVRGYKVLLVSNSQLDERTTGPIQVSLEYVSNERVSSFYEVVV